jgi:alcohol-forming fatty acyl-CoA reductase
VTRVRDALAGKRFFVTGATGFLGTALVERLLRTIPDSQVVLLIRPGRRSSAMQRASREILKNDCFDRFRELLGDRFDDEVASRVTAVAGDVGTDGLGLDDDARQVLSTCDIVIHSAATVSFDSPLDSAVEVNLLGPSRVAAAVVQARADAAEDGRFGPAHFIPVSTAYVAGTHQGEAPEELLENNPYSLDVDWRGEVTAARRLRSDADAESRHPKRLASFAKAARGELGGAGIHLLAERAERLREDWVRKQLVDAGKARAAALGWPDAYAYTKSLGERALTAQYAGVLPYTIVRPSIIESALAEPVPGWIRGFRMAEPIIVSYARGLLKEFPGVPEGVIDVIPVDLVVAAIIAVAADGPSDDGRPSVYHVASGVRNPFRYGRLVELVQSWFTDHPIYDTDGQPIVVPEWSFPGRGRVQRQLQRAGKVMEAAERIVGTLPVRGRQAAWMAALEERHLLADRALGYVELYGAYTETEARYRVDRLLELWDRIDPDERALFCFDPGEIDWDRYVHDIHLPSVVDHARVRTTPEKSTQPVRSDRLKKAILSPDRHLAAFDLENTLIASNVVDSYAWLASRHLPAAQRVTFVAELVQGAPALLALDRRDRGDFLRSFYRRYEGAPVERLRADAWDLFHDLLLAKSFPAGFARLRQHRALGHRTILITGALDLIVEPLRPLFDEIICAHLSEQDGRFTGRMEDLPPIGEARALVLAEYAQAEGLRLEESIAYADSASDLPMLDVVGFPVAVNPEAKLAAIARRRGWHVEHWSKSRGGARRLLPLGPLDTPRSLRRGSRVSQAALTGALRRNLGQVDLTTGSTEGYSR